MLLVPLQSDHVVPTIPTEMIAYHNGLWCDLESAQLSLDDWGVLQGVMLVERLRTFGGKIFQLSKHLTRLQNSVEAVGVSWKKVSEHPLVSIIESVANAAKNRWANDPDIGLVLLVTPGMISGPTVGQPTVIIHASRLPWGRMQHWYDNGQALLTSSIRNVPHQCWPVSIKTRSRLHYYLADREAAAHGSHCGALLLNLLDQVTETSFANVMMVTKDGTLVAPPADEVLPGISLEQTSKFAQELGLTWQNRPISIEEFREAAEILLSGTNGTLWHANSLDGIPLSSTGESSVLAKLRRKWSTAIGLDYVQQARSVTVS